METLTETLEVWFGFWLKLVHTMVISRWVCYPLRHQRYRNIEEKVTLYQVILTLPSAPILKYHNVQARLQTSSPFPLSEEFDFPPSEERVADEDITPI
ncbi:hypothetical protein PoB_006349400 [Plakobranchus ocellatus]|uniref:Uncharacterized protein n=1 Tax=Plakobranchus ocellatus TaxID=259542 RepID=A0AAV4CYK4_9GAST|nr:hypothetical protein PoB_006349400 [Plakobranchus ocellatus]